LRRRRVSADAGQDSFSWPRRRDLASYSFRGIGWENSGVAGPVPSQPITGDGEQSLSSSIGNLLVLEMVKKTVRRRIAFENARRPIKIGAEDRARSRRFWDGTVRCKRPCLQRSKSDPRWSELQTGRNIAIDCELGVTVPGDVVTYVFDQPSAGFYQSLCKLVNRPGGDPHHWMNRERDRRFALSRWWS